MRAKKHLCYRTRRRKVNPVIDLENEIWKPVNGYESIYSVSNLGRVKMLGRKWLSSGFERVSNERLIKPFLNKNKWHRVSLVIDNKNVKKFQLHRLVGIAFIPNPENKPEINHIDGNPSNNKVENLEWCTRAENAQHACDTGLMKPIRGGSNANAKRILCTTLGLEFSCLPEAEEVLGISRSGISAVINNKKLHVFGLVFRNI